MVNPIIPVEQLIYKTSGERIPDLEAICVFSALGFFLGDDTYWKNEKVLLPSFSYQKDDQGNIIPGIKTFDWYYEPRQVSLNEVVEEFADLFATITRDQTNGKKVILPLSGGLDSRTQAVALKDIQHPSVHSYSYRFKDSFKETWYGKKIAQKCGYPFLDLTIPEGYLWDVIDQLADINRCYSDFTHPRQMAVTGELAPLGNVFYLGHWGDVLFDDMGLDENASCEQQYLHLKHKVVKKGGEELARKLWQAWGLAGSFDHYLDDRLHHLFDDLKIKSPNARIRAFKSLYWAPRWTSVNINVFSAIHPVALPYYDDRMCRFICSVPEKYLAARQIQIEYIKRNAPDIARIPWQTFHPCNLYNYPSFGSVRYYPYRLWRKGGQVWREKVLGRPLVIRNWENQFLGTANQQQLTRNLFDNKAFGEFVPEVVTRSIFNAFNGKDEVFYSHPLSMLLTLSLFARKYL